AAVAHAPRHFPPGGGWRYSNTGYALLGTVVESVAGERLERVLAERITRPLGSTTPGGRWRPAASPRSRPPCSAAGCCPPSCWRRCAAPSTLAARTSATGWG